MGNESSTSDPSTPSSEHDITDNGFEVVRSTGDQTMPTPSGILAQDSTDAGETLQMTSFNPVKPFTLISKHMRRRSRLAHRL